MAATSSSALQATHIGFDVDGVLVEGFHFNPKYRRAWTVNMLADLGIDPASFETVFFRSSIFESVIVGKADLTETLTALAPQFGGNGKVAELIHYWHKSDDNPIPEMLDIATSLRQSGRKTFLSTHQTHERADYLWNDMNFNQHFDDCFHSARVGCMKTDPAFFHYITKTLGVSPSECLQVDDTPSVLEAAKHAGWQTFWLETPEHAEQLAQRLNIAPIYGR